jgi:hypothetical protein
MLDTLLERPFFLNRHREAPLLKERETFLHHLQQQGTSRAALQDPSNELLQVVRLLKLDEMRDVTLEAIQRAAQCWACQQRSNPRAHSYGNSASFFIYAAKKWFRFHDRLKLPSAPRRRFADQLSDFARYMTEEQGLSPHSVRSHCWKTSKFLTWFGERHRSLVRVSVEDVDEFLAMKGAAGWSRKSVSVAAQALRAFFRYAETRGWCAAGFAKGIQAPKIYQDEGLPEGPTEKEVRQLLQSVKGSGLSRLASTDASMHCRMRLATNPGGPGHALHQHLFLGNRCPHCEIGGREAGKIYTDATWLSDKLPLGMSTQYIFGKWDPKGLLPDYHKQLRTQGKAFSKQLLEGCWRAYIFIAIRFISIFIRIRFVSVFVRIRLIPLFQKRKGRPGRRRARRLRTTRSRLRLEMKISFDDRLVLGPKIRKARHAGYHCWNVMQQGFQ